jgi:7,8-dihydropterin-6-yl-methyl-4-(beta-D-ribofuranosyl)aminobenzene 5'-phosphate synthase
MMDEAVQEEIPHHIPTLVAHPWCFCPRTKESGQNIGSPIGVERIASRIPVELSEKAVYLTDDLIFLGEIPRVHSFEDPAPSRRQIWLSDGTVREDLLTDDTALVYLGSEGMVILTGCAHSGICNIITRAQEMTGEDRVRDIVGGLHLIRPSAERMEGTRAFLTTQEIQSLHPCHCTSFAARCSLAQDLPVEETGVGLRLIY